MKIDHLTRCENSMEAGTREWADKNVNCIEGCKYNCRYCYAKLMSMRFKRRTKYNWDRMIIKNKIVCKKFKRSKGRIMFPSTHDIYPNEPYLSACLKTVKNILKPGNHLLITTKPSKKGNKKYM